MQATMTAFRPRRSTVACVALRLCYKHQADGPFVPLDHICPANFILARTPSPKSTPL